MKLAQKCLAVTLIAFSQFALAAGPEAASPSRAEVRAEAVLAMRSGLMELQRSPFYDPLSAETKAAQAKVASLKQGAEYRAEVERQKAASALTPAGSSTVYAAAP